jgi:ABC-type nickel/cobalt efflux system permease component RcnA
VLTACYTVAHPIPLQHHDRSILIRVTENAVIVEYTLALDSRTQATDLFALRDQLPKPPALDEVNKVYAELYGPRIAAGLVGNLDGHALTFSVASHQLKIEDHLRYLFVLQAPLKVNADKPTHSLQVIDSNFAVEPGVFLLGLRSEGPVVLKQSSVAGDPQRARPVNMSEYAQAQNQQLRTADATFVMPAALGLPGPQTPAQSAAAADEKPSFWEVVKSLDLRRLVDSDVGLAMLLLLAFVFGAAHALQPGHGKTLVAAYLVGENGTIAHAFFLGLVTTLTHTSSAILIALVIPLFYPDMDTEIAFALELGCGLLIVVMAFWLLMRRLAGQADHVHLFGGHHHHHHDGHEHHHLPPGEKVSLWALITLGIAGGIVPCVDALALLTLTFVTKQIWLGLPMILAFSLGLASVLVAVGVMVVKFKRFAHSRWGQGRWVKTLPIVAAALTLLLGLWMCREALRNHEEMLRSKTSLVSHG